MMELALVLASLATDVSWTDRSGECPASRGRAAVDAAAQKFDDASIDIEVEATEDGLAATLRLETPNGIQTRTLQSPACDTLVEAAVLITRAAAMAAIVPEPPAVLEPAEPEPVAEPPSVAESEPVADPDPIPQPEAELERDPPSPAEARPAEPSTPRAPRPLFASLRGFGFGTFGTTPGVGGGGGLAVGLGSTFWRADVSGMVSAPTTTTQHPGIQAWAWAVGTRGCGTLDVLDPLRRPVLCRGRPRPPLYRPHHRPSSRPSQLLQRPPLLGSAAYPPTPSPGPLPTVSVKNLPSWRTLSNTCST